MANCSAEKTGLSDDENLNLNVLVVAVLTFVAIIWIFTCAGCIVIIKNRKLSKNNNNVMLMKYCQHQI
jgi:hypothetical protein